VVITCGGGTYIRALARDLGRLTASAAHLTALRRVRSGPFHVEDAASLDTLRAGAAVLLPAARALGGTPSQELDDEDVRRVVRGQDVDARVEGTRAALLHGGTGALVALAVRRGDRWQPRVVMRRA
jgi:tRNA pseudouridine55 synthase